MIFRFVFFATLMCFYSIAAFTAQLKAVALKQEANYTSLFLTINGAVTHKLFFFKSA